MKIWTIGHSTRSIENFVSLLKKNEIKLLADVRSLPGSKTVTPWSAAIMCAEAVWWRCHRSLISDYLKACDIEMMHILDANKVEPHPFTSAAHIVDGSLSYASEDDRLI